jgi:anti-sigma regulatory factor (Ser/Thr protein kinase)
VPDLPAAPVSIDLRIPSDVTEVEAAVELMARHCFAGVNPCARTTFRLRVALAEALANAIMRGNSEDPSKHVRVRAELFAESIHLSIEDQGDGFAPIEPTLPESLEDDRGRGLFIISQLADRVEFNDRGNAIWMTLPRC